MGARGPKPLPSHEKRSHRFHVHVNDEELSKLEKVIGQPGLAELVRSQSSRRKGMRLVAELMRAKLLGHRAPVRFVVPAVNQEVVADLGRVGSNLNQLAHHWNREALAGDTHFDVEAAVAEVHELRDQLEDALLGLGQLRTKVTPKPCHSSLSALGVEDVIASFRSDS